MDKKQVGIVVYEEVEVLDFCGPFEVFSVTGRTRKRDGGALSVQCFSGCRKRSRQLLRPAE